MSDDEGGWEPPAQEPEPFTLPAERDHSKMWRGLVLSVACAAVVAGIVWGIWILQGGPVVLPTEYPATRLDDTVEQLHGTSVKDPLRWMESETTDVENWVAAQNDFTDQWLQATRRVESIEEDLARFYDYDDCAWIGYAKGWYYRWIRPSGAEQYLFVRQRRLYLEEYDVVLDPVDVDPSGATTLSRFQFSHSGDYLAVVLTQHASDWGEVRVLDLGSKRFLPDRISDIRAPTICWNDDDSGFYYDRSERPRDSELQPTRDEIYFHRLGSPARNDREVYRDTRSDVLDLTPLVTVGDYIVVQLELGEVRNHGIYLVQISDPARVFELTSPERGKHFFVGSANGTLFFTSNRSPDYYTVFRIAATPGARWARLLNEEAGLNDVAISESHMLVSHWTGEEYFLAMYDHRGNEISRGPMTQSPLRGLTFDERAQTFRAFRTWFDAPSEIVSVGLDLSISEIWGNENYPRPLGDSLLVEARGKAMENGSIAWVTVLRDKDRRLDGTQPLLLIGYGAHGKSNVARFDPGLSYWLAEGGAIAYAHTRGGGEFGEEWHRRAVGPGRQLSFDDFISCAEVLIEGGFTSPERLFIMGGSAGGTMVSAVAVQRPDLFAGVICKFPMTDMIRYPRWGIGPYLISEYGDPEDSWEFDALLSYSPYHNLREGVKYPPMWVGGSSNDERTPAVHARKFAGLAQEYTGGAVPILYREYDNIGHGGWQWKSTARLQWKEQLVFLSEVLGWSR